MSKKILITGAAGQLASELIKTTPEGYDAVALSRSDLDISDLDAVSKYVNTIQPAAIINAAAYTAVDRAEEDVDTATLVNVKGIENLAKAAPEACYVLHVSTDFVFDGEKNTPYAVTDMPSPQSVYGETKLAGEQALFKQKPSKSAVIRTAWVYSSSGANFVKSMLRFMNERDELNIVVDQVGTPTWAKSLADVCWQSCIKQIEGTFHWSDAGVASWYDFAEMIQRLGVEFGVLQKPIRLNAIPSSAYPTPAKRPSYSVLDKSALLEALPEVSNDHWVSQLRLMFEEMKRES